MSIRVLPRRRVVGVDLLGTPPTWWDLALCPEVGSELFFPAPADLGNEAKAVCRLCPVTDECLTYALDHRIADGVWGATTPNDRERILRGGNHD